MDHEPAGAILRITLDSRPQGRVLVAHVLCADSETTIVPPAQSMPSLLDAIEERCADLGLLPPECWEADGDALVGIADPDPDHDPFEGI